MNEPTPEQIEAYLAYVADLEIFWWNHFGGREPVPNLVEVDRWLRAKSVEEKVDGT